MVEAHFSLSEQRLNANFELQQNAMPAVFKINAGAAWGSIVGNIENQTDLQEALALKYDASNPENYQTDVQVDSKIAEAIEGYIKEGDNVSLLTNDAGYITKAVNNLDNYMLTTDINAALDLKQDVISDLSTIRAKANSAIQPNDNISELTNDVGYITKAVNNLENYTKTEDLADVALSGAYSDLSGQPTELSQFNNDTNFITLQSLSGTTPIAYSQTTGVISVAQNYQIPTVTQVNKIGQNETAITSINNTLGTYGNIVTHNIEEVATAQQGALAETSLQPSDIINNVTSTATNKTLSANMGKELQDQIDNLQGRGKFLSIWDCTTGLATTTPPVDPYTYETGSYFIVGVVGETNYRPSGATYSSTVPSTVVETETVKVNDTYYYDGTVWRLLDTPEKDVLFASISGSPYDNTNLAGALNLKYDASNPDNFISKSDLSATSPIAYNNGVISVASGYQIPTTAQVGLINNAIQPNDNISELTNDLGYITGISSSDVTTALGFTPYNATNPQGYQTAAQVQTAITTATQNMVETGDNITVLNNNAGYITSSYHDATKQNVISDLDDIRAGAELGSTAVQPVTLNNYVPTSRKINGQTLTQDITIPVSGLSDVSITSPTQGQNLTYDATNNVWKNTSTTATVAWGGITGTLSEQTDLQNALNGKQPTGDYATNTRVDEVEAEIPTVPTNVSAFTNDSGYITNSALTGYATETYVDNHHDSTKQDVISDLTTIRSNASAGKTASDTIATYGNIVTHNTSEFATSEQGAKADSAVQNLSDLGITATASELNVLDGITASTTELNYVDGVTSAIQTQLNSKQATISDLATIRTGAELGATALQQTDIINNTTSTATNKALSANAGKSLQDQLNNLLGRGKYLSIWDCTTGLAMDEPPVNPYTVEVGSYFIVGKVASAGGTNYRPNGGTYDKDVPSTTVETNPVKVNDTYYYDGTQWRLLDTPVTDVAFSTLAGSPYDNTNLANALNSKVTGNNAITGSTHTKITYDSKGLVTSGADLSASDIPNLTLSKISDVTATASELNVLDGITASTTELNYTDGVTSNIQTQLNSKQNITDNTLTTTSKTIVGAINEVNAKPSMPSLDEVTITTNSDDELQAIAVIDSSDNATALRTWTGTKAEYDAITTKDNNTLYNITDDTDITLSLLQTIYPVGSIYITTNNTCPLSALFGTWQLVGADRVLQGAGTRGTVGTTLEESLPNIKGSVVPAEKLQSYSGVFYDNGAKWANTQSYTTGGNGLGFDASLSSSTYQDNAPVQPDAYLVNIFRRVS